MLNSVLKLFHWRSQKVLCLNVLTCDHLVHLLVNSHVKYVYMGLVIQLLRDLICVMIFDRFVITCIVTNEFAIVKNIPGKYLYGAKIIRHLHE